MVKWRRPRLSLQLISMDETVVARKQMPLRTVAEPEARGTHIDGESTWPLLLDDGATEPPGEVNVGLDGTLGILGEDSADPQVLLQLAPVDEVSQLFKGVAQGQGAGGPYRRSGQVFTPLVETDQGLAKNHQPGPLSLAETLLGPKTPDLFAEETGHGTACVTG